MNLRKANNKDFSQMAFIHNEAFRGFFLTSLGTGFLETYYKSILKDERTIAVCAVDDRDNVLGFASGCIQALNYHRNLFYNNSLSFLIAVLGAAIRKPEIIFRLAMNINKNQNHQDDSNYAELLSIAILPELKGSGTGKNLLEYFETETSKRGGRKLALTTDYDNNDQVVNFYKKCGYLIFYDFITYPNRRMYKMIKTL
jgi:ribosomal protein S18 acetylase RimI-like enzyme